MFAKGEGAVSRLMTLRVLVLLGEISYSCYLIHHILLYTYHANAAKFAHIPDAFAFSIFLVVLFLASYLLWSLVEMPARRLLVGRHAIHSTPSMRWSWRVFLRPSRPLFAGIALILVLSMVRTNCHHERMIRDAVLVRLVPVRADADVDHQRHAKRRDAGHQLRQLALARARAPPSGTSSTSSSCTCRTSLRREPLALEPVLHRDHRELDEIGGGALHRRVDRRALGACAPRPAAGA